MTNPIKNMISLLAVSTIMLLAFKIQSPENTLTLDISNIKDPKGAIYVQVFNATQHFPKPPYAFQTVIKPEGKTKVSVSFSNVVSGDYAVAVYQDSNNNGKFDRNFIGIPKEPYALSQNFHPKMSAPTFEECKISVGPNKSQFNLELVN